MLIKIKKEEEEENGMLGSRDMQPLLHTSASHEPWSPKVLPKSSWCTSLQKPLTSLVFNVLSYSVENRITNIRRVAFSRQWCASEDQWIPRKTNPLLWHHGTNSLLQLPPKVGKVQTCGQNAGQRALLYQTTALPDLLYWIHGHSPCPHSLCKGSRVWGPFSFLLSPFLPYFSFHSEQ